MRTVAGIRICIRPRMRNCQQTLTVASQHPRSRLKHRSLPQQDDRLSGINYLSAVASHEGGPVRRSLVHRRINYRPSTRSSLCELFVYDLDLLVEHLPGKAIYYNMHRTMLLPFHNEIVLEASGIWFVTTTLPTTSISKFHTRVARPRPLKAGCRTHERA